MPYSFCEVLALFNEFSIFCSDETPCTYSIIISVCGFIENRLRLWLEQPKLGCCNSHTFSAVFCYCFQVETICSGNWSETSNSRVSHQQKVHIYTLFMTVVRYLKPSNLNYIRNSIRWATICLISSAWLKGPPQSTVGKLDQKISMLTGLNVKHPYGEYLQVVNYGIGGHYEPHFDHATVSWLWDLLNQYIYMAADVACCLCWHKQWYHNVLIFQSPSSPVFRLKTGNRLATFMIYVSEVLFQPSYDLL